MALMSVDRKVRVGADGLSEEEVLRSRERHGSNTLTRQRRKSFWRQFLTNLGDPIIRILLAALAIKLIMLFREPDVVETVGIGIAVLLATLISTVSEYGSARAFERLSELEGGKLCRVRRGGSVREVPIADLVVGDLVLLDAGELIPADGLLRSGRLRVDQAAMTGEGAEVEKCVGAEPATRTPSTPNALFRGCTVTNGSGEMEVLAVGDATFIGEISREIQMEQRESPLRRRLSRLAGQISRLGYCAAVLVALAYLFNVLVIDSGMRSDVILFKLSDLHFMLSHLLHAFTLGLTVLVVAVPEGLPMMIAVVLSSNIRRMIKGGVLVRKPVGIESAGSMNILFTDKTGTLTEGRMRASSILTCDESIAPASLSRTRSTRGDLIALALRMGVGATEGVGADGAPTALGGNATDRALLQCVLGKPMPKGARVVSRLPFDSARKYAAVTLGGVERMTVVIGAPERILACVRDAVGESGERRAISARRLQREIGEHTAAGERVVAIALLPEGGDAARLAERADACGALTFLCAVCLRDPLRAEARDSVKSLKGAGIHVVMITGDSPETGGRIAAECGILDEEHRLILTGEELARISDTRLCELLPQIAVVARALPNDKSRLVRLAQESGLVVGMTGDGINDAPALRRADVGFAMGGGTQVAKDAGDIVILDNNLASIARAVLFGRNVFKSIRKFITLQLTMNFYAVGVTMICPFLGIESPVTVVQMLWINLIMDTLGGLAFAGEPPLPSCMRERPKRRDEPILNGYMIHQILFCGGFTAALCILFLKHPFFTSMFRPSEDGIYLLTAFFAFFIFASVFNCFSARTDRLRLMAGIGKNPVFIAIMAAILIIQLVFVYVGGSVLRTAPLTPQELLVTFSLALAVLPADLIRKALLRLVGSRSASF